ncbi:MAG: hypothetical protein IJU99_03410 [Lachnospiraceae bacterium]|nr:hypothetical protein [Lachnospiraceae bacterium]
MFQRIDWADRLLPVWGNGLLPVAAVLLCLAGVLLLRKMRRCGGRTLLGLGVICLVVTFLRFLPFSVDFTTRQNSGSFPKVLSAEHAGLPLVPERELDAEALGRLGEILSQCELRREMSPGTGAGALAESVRLDVMLRDSWAGGGAVSETLVGYQLDLFAGEKEGALYDPEKVQAELTVRFGNGAQTRLRIADAEDFLERLVQEGLIEERDALVGVSELEALEKAAGFQTYQTNSSGETFGSFYVAQMLSRAFLSEQLGHEVSYREYQDYLSRQQEEKGYAAGGYASFLPDLIAVSGGILGYDYSQSSSDVQQKEVERVFGYVRREDLNPGYFILATEEPHRIYSNDGKTLLAEADSIHFLVYEIASLWPEEEMAWYQEEQARAAERVNEINEAVKRLEKEMEQRRPDWYGGIYHLGNTGHVVIQAVASAEGVQEGIEECLGYSDQLLFRMDAAYSYREMEEGIAWLLEDTGSRMALVSAMGRSDYRNRIEICLKKDSEENRAAFAKIFSEYGDPGMLAFLPSEEEMTGNIGE